MNDELIDDLQDELESGPGGQDELGGKPDTPKFDPEAEFKRMQAAQRASDERIASLTRELSETKAAAAYRPAEKAEEPKPPASWIDEVETKGPAAFDSRFVTREDFNKKAMELANEAQERVARQQLQGSYPDLFVPGSDFRQRVDELIETKFKAPAQVEATALWALENAAEMAKQEFERAGKMRSARTNAAGGMRPMSGTSGGGPSRPTALTPGQRKAASDFQVSQKDMLASVVDLAENRR